MAKNKEPMYAPTPDPVMAITATQKKYEIRQDNVTGRPRIIPNNEIIKLYASRGMSLEQTCRAMGFDESTLLKGVRAKDPIWVAAREAYSVGKAEGVAAVSNVMFQKAANGDTLAAMFWLKCVGGWRETQVVEHSGVGGGPIEVNDVRDRFLRQLSVIDVTPEPIKLPDITDVTEVVPQIVEKKED